MASTSASTSAGPVQGKVYRRGIDVLRFVACFGIVWDHARAYGADIGYLALAVFLILTSFFAVQSYDRAMMKGQAAGFWQSRSSHILMPWLVWCAFYKLVALRLADDPWAVPLLSEPMSLLLGSYIHLWFLPFVMIFLVVIPPTCRLIQTRRDLILACIGLTILSLPLGRLHAELGLMGWFESNLPFPQPLPQWFFSLPLFLYGALAAIAHRIGAVSIVLAAATVISVCLWLIAPEFASVQMILAALVFEVVWRIKINAEWPTKLASAAFGIYLLHPFFMLVVFKLFSDDVNREFGAIAAFCMAWIATLVMMRLPYLRRIV